jgi:hypothetical protein
MGSMWMDPEEENRYPICQLQPDPFDEKYIRDDITQFPVSKWGSDFISMAALAEFASTNWWNTIVLDPPRPPASDEVKDELKKLVDMQTNERPGRLEEIYAQASDFQAYLVAQLGISRRSHPQTYLLLKIAARVAEFTMVPLKARYNRVRPSQLYPRLFPPIDVPNHAAYPSGHAMSARMMAFAMVDVVPEMEDAPEHLSLRIAVNREVAGLHYPSDTAAGISAAAQAFGILKNLTWYKKVRAAARDEWS